MENRVIRSALSFKKQSHQQQPLKQKPLQRFNHQIIQQKHINQNLFSSSAPNFQNSNDQNILVTEEIKPSLVMKQQISKLIKKNKSLLQQKQKKKKRTSSSSSQEKIIEQPEQFESIQEDELEQPNSENYEIQLTEAEKKYQQKIKEREQEQLKNNDFNKKSFKEKLNEFNQKLQNMPEHFDIPKVGPG